MKYRISEDERQRRREQMRIVRANQSPEARFRGGKTRGDRHAAEKTGVCGRSQEQMILDAKKGGLAGGYAGSQHPNSKAAWRAMLKNSDHQRAAGRVGGHVSNHVNKGRFNPLCEFCLTAFEQE
jgi:hypothetical protein